MRKLSLSFLSVLLAAALSFGAAGVSLAAKPTIGSPCIQCHSGTPDVVRGELGTRSEKFSTINVNVGNIVWVIKYDDGTQVKGAANIEAIPKGREVAVTFTGDVKTAKATSVSVKQPYKVPAEQLASVGYMKEMVAKGPGAGGYMLIDARPTPKYLEGHIPGAISMPYAAFDRMQAQLLPKNKGSLLIFYCGGDT